MHAVGQTFDNEILNIVNQRSRNKQQCHQNLQKVE